MTWIWILFSVCDVSLKLSRGKYLDFDQQIAKHFSSVYDNPRQTFTHARKLLFPKSGLNIHTLHNTCVKYDPWMPVIIPLFFSRIPKEYNSIKLPMWPFIFLNNQTHRTFLERDSVLWLSLHQGKFPNLSNIVHLHNNPFRNRLTVIIPGHFWAGVDQRKEFTC